MADNGTGETGNDEAEKQSVNKYSQARITRCKRRVRRKVRGKSGLGELLRRKSRFGYVFRERRVHCAR